MSYIGNRPVIGNFVKLDSIASQFNGSTVAFTLKVGGVNTVPGSAQNLIIAVGGVIQEPAVAYSISASTITFTSAPATNATFWGVQLGDVLTIGTPSNGTVGLSQLSATGTPSTTTFLRGDNAWSQVGVSAISATGTPSSTTYLRGDGSWNAPTVTSPQVYSQAFYSSGSWTAPTGVTRVRVWVVGGAAGGSIAGCGAAGGVGGMAMGVYTVSPGTGYTVTIGAGGAAGTTSTSGGTTSFGGVISATGGSGTGGGPGASGSGSGGTVFNSVSWSAASGLGVNANWSIPIAGGFSSGSYANFNKVAAAQVAGGTYPAGISGTSVGGIGGMVYLEWVQ